MAGVLRQPDPEVVTPRKAAAVLRRLGLEWAAEPGYVPHPLPPVVPLSLRSPRDWWIDGEALVSYVGQPEDFPHRGNWTCDRDPSGRGECWQVAAAILVHCWNLPELRPLFEAPAWSLDLLDLLRPAEPPPIPERRRGWIRYTLLSSVPPGGALPIERTLIRRSRRDGRVLKPRSLPAELDELVSEVDGLTEADLTLHDVHAALLALQRPPAQTPPERVEAHRARLRARAFACLLDAHDLRFGGEAVHPVARPLTPVLRAVDGAEGLLLSWTPTIVAVFAMGPGYVVTADREFRPLATRHAPRDPLTLLADLPGVPVDEAAEFGTRFVRQSAVPLSLRSAHLPRTVAADDAVGIIRLREDGEALIVSVAIEYRVGEAAVAVDPTDPAPMVPVGEVLLRRDGPREDALIAEAETALSEPLPARLEGDAALGVLLDGLPALPRAWRIEGEASLRRHRVAGRLGARVVVPSGIDWLDLDLRFAVGDTEVAAAEVLASWRAGLRYHRLDDGSLAQLPEQWLVRHGAMGEELLGMRKAGGGQLSVHAAPLVAALLDEAEGDLTRWRDALTRLADFDRVPDRPLPPELTATLRAYQVTGYRWLCWLRDLGLGGVLADDMGLGKTVQALALLLDVHREPGPPSLVVAPTSILYGWADEAARFAPTLRVHVHHGPGRPAMPPEDADLVVTSYALLRTDEAAFDRPWRVLVLDEAQRIKNPASHVARAARRVRASFRFGLTGTPLENHLLELWSLFECLMPGFFGSRGIFQRRYALPIERDRDPEALAALRARLRPFVLRRLKTEVARELPPRQDQVLYCELGEKQRQLYERVKATYRDAVLRRVDAVGLARAALPVLEALMRLRQACCDPALLPFPEAVEVGESAKLDLLEETLEEAIETGHRTLVFSQWTSLLARVKPRLEARGWAYLYLDGSTRDRHGLVGRWNEPDGPPVFLISLKAGGAGLNLTGADHVIHLDPWWNPAVEDQATDRAHRIGQTRPVVAYKLVARDTVEERILALQARKRALFDAAVDRDRFDVEQLSRADLEAVLAPADEAAAPLAGGASLPEIDDDIVHAPAAAEATPTGLDVLLRRGMRLTNAVVRDRTGWSAAQARVWLQAQVDAGRLVQRGVRRGTFYLPVDR